MTEPADAKPPLRQDLTEEQSELVRQGREIRRNYEATAAAATTRKPAPTYAPPKPEPYPPLRSWSEVVIPASVTNVREALTYVPGLVGDIVEWIVAGATRPNRMMALGTAITVVGTLIGRRIMGPTESATHLYVILLAPTGYGKDWPLRACAVLMDGAGAQDLLGPNEFASAPGLVKRLKRNPLMLCPIDELGDELAKIKSQSGNVWLTAIIGTLKKSYNAWEIVITAEKVNEESIRIDWPALSIIGAATAERFFETLQPGDLESGFANRLLLLPFEDHRRPPERLPANGASEPTADLLAGLKLLPRQRAIGMKAILDAPGDGSVPPKPTLDRIEWGPGAQEVYLGFSREMDALEGKDAQRYRLSMRACENAARLATNLAVGRGSRTVDCEDITWAIGLASQSVEAACGGVDKYMSEYFEFPKFCDRVLEWLKSQPNRFAPPHLIARKFGRNQRNAFEIDNVLRQLVKEQRIIDDTRSSSRGPDARGYRALDD
jgi:hypothetical protein